MKIKFLGSGSAFTLAKENYQSNILISKKVNTDSSLPKPLSWKHLLFDAGETIQEALNSQGIVSQDLDSIYISHLHGDHSGGIEGIAFRTYFLVHQFGKTEFGSMKPNLIGHQSILREGWDNSWKGGLQSIQGETNTLESYFNTNYLQDNDTFDFYGTEMKPIQTEHVRDDKRDMPSYGLIFKENNTNVFITGDTKFKFYYEYEQADMIFQDVEFAEYPGSVHAQFHLLCTLPEEVKKKMWLYHYSLGGRTYEELETSAINNGFAGLVKRGQEFEI